MGLTERIKDQFIHWLQKDQISRHGDLLCDFDRIQYEIRPCDVLLIEGTNRVSDIIRMVTESPWTHAALYIGKFHDIQNPILREKVLLHYQGGSLEKPIILESVLGKGTIATPLEKYRGQHIRICRPAGLSMQDVEKVIEFAIEHLGLAYDIRQNFDLLRFLYPWRFMPRRWRSSLFNRSSSPRTKEICSLMIAEAFAHVNFPILPIIKIEKDEQVHFYHRNLKLFTPRDFDYSPYFEIIKYPMFEISEHAAYRKLPWAKKVELPMEKNTEQKTS